MKSPLDQHLVIHDATTLAFSAICGAVGGAILRSWELGALMAGAVITLGFLAMRVGPTRRGINRAVTAARQATR